MTTENTNDIEEAESNDRLAALVAHLNCEADDITEGRDDGMFELGNQEYLVLTDSEADDRAAEYIKDSLWAFKSSFLAGYTNLPEEIFTAMQDQCEDANDTFYTLVSRAEGGVDGFIEQAISADGRGHFMSSYDGEENEETVNGETYYIYRTN